jgi:hypothetical protein
MMEFKTFKFQIKEIDDTGRFTGHSSVFGNVDSYDDVVDKGAFAKTISDNKGIFPILWMHDPWNPVGISTSKEDDKGLYVEGQIDLDTPEGKRVYSGLKKGYIDRMSIGYRTIKYDTDDDGVRHLKEIKLMENSLVTKNFAANELALVESVKTLGDENFPDLLKAVVQLKKEGTASKEKIKEAITSLKALLDDEPSNDTQNPKAAIPPSEPDDHSDEIKRLFEELNVAKEFEKEQALLDEFRNFGKSLSEVN